MTLQVNRSNNKSQAVTGAAPFQKGLIHTGTNMYIFRHYYAPLKGTKKACVPFFPDLFAEMEGWFIWEIKKRKTASLLTAVCLPGVIWNEDDGGEGALHWC